MRSPSAWHGCQVDFKRTDQPIGPKRATQLRAHTLCDTLVLPTRNGCFSPKALPLSKLFKLQSPMPVHTACRRNSERISQDDQASRPAAKQRSKKDPAKGIPKFGVDVYTVAPQCSPRSSRPGCLAIYGSFLPRNHAQARGTSFYRHPTSPIPF